MAMHKLDNGYPTTGQWLSTNWTMAIQQLNIAIQQLDIGYPTTGQ